jgi:hypothetical protein
MGPFGRRLKQGSSVALDGRANSGEQQRGEVGPWVKEMAGEVGDSIWSPVKEEAHQRAVSTGVRLGRTGTTVRGSIQWWRSAANGSKRWLDTSGRWGGVDGARRWSEAARRWSATARYALAVEE